jgi:hypothetical protein
MHEIRESERKQGRKSFITNFTLSVTITKESCGVDNSQYCR